LAGVHQQAEQPHDLDLAMIWSKPHSEGHTFSSEFDHCNDSKVVEQLRPALALATGKLALFVASRLAASVERSSNHGMDTSMKRSSNLFCMACVA